MKQVKIERVKLLNKIQENREKHIKEFEQALADYRKAMIFAVIDMLEMAKREEDVQWPAGLRKPENHAEDYDEVILMLSMSEDGVITLDRNEFTQYVMDDWAWKGHFAHAVTTNVNYLNSKV